MKGFPFLVEWSDGTDGWHPYGAFATESEARDALASLAKVAKPGVSLAIFGPDDDNPLVVTGSL